MIGQRIKERREALGLTQKELATKMGYKSNTTINKVELGINDVTQTNIVKYAEALNCTPGYLMGWEETMTESTAELSIDMLDDPVFVDYAKKLFYADQKVKDQVYSYIDFLLRN